MSRYPSRQDLARTSGVTETDGQQHGEDLGPDGRSQRAGCDRNRRTQESIGQAIRPTRPGGHPDVVAAPHSATLPGDELFISIDPGRVLDLT
jgi:hypothetical protein